MTRIILVRKRPAESWIQRLIQDAIVFFTRSYERTGEEITHAALRLDELLYESAGFTPQGILDGTRVESWESWADRWGRENLISLEVRGVDEQRLFKVCEDRVGKERPYNLGKLISLAVVYPFRGLFRLLGWVPFNAPVWGEVCSGFVDEVLKEAGLDIMPEEFEGYTAPCDFLWIPHPPLTQVMVE